MRTSLVFALIRRNYPEKKELNPKFYFELSSYKSMYNDNYNHYLKEFGLNLSLIERGGTIGR